MGKNVIRRKSLETRSASEADRDGGVARAEEDREGARDLEVTEREQPGQEARR